MGKLPLLISMPALLLLLVGSTLLWMSSVLRRDASLVDRWWGLAYVAVAWLAVATRPATPLPWQAWVLVALVTLWGVRLSVHLTRRNWNHGEDPRYTAMRAQRWERFALWSLPAVHWLQALLVWIIAWPILAALGRGARPSDGGTVLALLGAAAWLTGFAFEAVGDWQLARHRADSALRGTVLDTGLWRYTRHPNYFGDAMVWWGHWLVACSLGAWWTVFSPVLMTFLLMRVSGVTLLESQLKERRPGYLEYVARTSPFVPRRPRRN